MKNSLRLYLCNVVQRLVLLAQPDEVVRRAAARSARSMSPESQQERESHEQQRRSEKMIRLHFAILLRLLHFGKYRLQQRIWNDVVLLNRADIDLIAELAGHPAVD